MNPTILKVRLVDEKGSLVRLLERKAFGDFTIGEKVKELREDCKRDYPDLTIEDPITFIEVG